MAYITGVINEQEWSQLKDVLARGHVEVQAHGFMHNGETYITKWTSEEIIRQELERITQKALAQHGLFFPKLEVKIQATAEKSTANLLVKITDPGPAAVIDEIVVEGNRKNSKAEILEFLGLKTGMPITRATLRRWR